MIIKPLLLTKAPPLIKAQLQTPIVIYDYKTFMVHIFVFGTHRVLLVNYFLCKVYTFNLDIVAITETWLHSNIFDNEILPSGYQIYRKDCNRRGGGVVLAIKNSIPSKLLSTPSDLELLAVSVSLTEIITVA